MSTFQRMLTPPMSEINSSEEEQVSEPVQVFMSRGKGDRVFSGWIKNPPFIPEHPDQYRKTRSSRPTKKATKQKNHSSGNPLPSIMDSGSDNDAADKHRKDSSASTHAETFTCASPILGAGETYASNELHLDTNKLKEDIESSDSTLVAATPPPSADDDDLTVEGGGFHDSHSMVNQGDSLLRKMVSAPVSDDNSPPKKQSYEKFRVFMHSGNWKTKPNKDNHILRSVGRNPPFKPNPPNPDKEVKNPHLSAAEKKKLKEKRERAKEKQARCCGQKPRPFTVSDNDADKEDNGIISPASSNIRSSSSSTTQEYLTPPTTPARPIITRSRSKQLAHEAAQEQTIDDQYLTSPSTSPPSLKCERSRGCVLREDSPGTERPAMRVVLRPGTPVSPLTQRPAKRLRSSPGSSPLTSPNPRPAKRARRQ